MEFKNLIAKARSLIECGLGWFPPALTRVSLGLMFAETGWGKIHNFPKVIEYFTSLGIPFPELNAHVVAFNELICGTLILVGLFTRLASIPLAVSMVVAIVTAKKSDINELTDLFGIAEYLYIVLFAWLAVRGPGALSLDHLIFRKWNSQTRAGSTS